MILYAITDRTLLAAGEPDRRERLLALVQGWSEGGVDYLQLREKDLSEQKLAELAAGVVLAARGAGATTKVLINHPEAEIAAAIALGVGADGVHLPGGLSAARLLSTVERIRQRWRDALSGCRPGEDPAISVSCHSADEVLAARAARADLALFAPVFSKALPGGSGLAGVGLPALTAACLAAKRAGADPEIPVLALGGVTANNAALCRAAGASGIAAIRLFLHEWRALPARIAEDRTANPE